MEFKWIYRVLDSIKVQKYSKYRIIYINDCSSDNTLQVLEKYKNENNWMNISVITNQERSWPAYSRFAACKKVYDNEICVFLDGDDWLVNDNCLNIFKIKCIKIQIFMPVLDPWKTLHGNIENGKNTND